MTPKLQKRTRKYTVRLPPVVITPEMAERIHIVADEEETSLSEVVRFAISLFLEGRSRKSTHKVDKQLDTQAEQS